MGTRIKMATALRRSCNLLTAASRLQVLGRFAALPSRGLATDGSGYQHILVENRGEAGNVGLITLNRPKALNALCNDLMLEVGILKKCKIMNLVHALLVISWPPGIAYLAML